MSSYLLGLALAPTIMYAVNNLYTKKSSKEIGNVNTAIIMTGAGIIPLVIGALFFPFQVTVYEVILSIIGGIFLGFGRVLFFKPMETQQISNTAVFLLIQTVLLAVFGVYSLGETLTTGEILASVVMIVGMVLVATTKDFRFNRAMFPAITGNVMFVVYWIFLGYAISAGSTSEIALLAIAWASGTATTFIAFKYVLHSSMTRHKRTKARPISAVLAGLINGSGNIMQGALVYLNVFALGSLFSALNPVFTAFFAYFFFKDRLTRLQMLGLVVATIGAVAIVAYGQL